MVDFTIERYVKVKSATTLSVEDKFEILNWVLGRMTGTEAMQFADRCRYPTQISKIYKRLGDEEPS